MSRIVLVLKKDASGRSGGTVLAICRSAASSASASGPASRGDEGKAPRVPPRSGHVRELSRRRGLAEDLLPAPEAREREVWRGRPRLHVRNLTEHRRRHGLGELARGPDRFRRPPVHAGRLPEHVEVVRVVEPGDHGVRPALRQVRAVGLHRPDVRTHGVGIAADPQVDVGGHVDDVPRPRHERSQPVGGRLAAPRIRTALDGVDVEMVRARVVRVRAQHPFQGLEDLRGLGLHAAVGLPQVPRPQVHRARRRTAWRRRGRRGSAAPPRAWRRRTRGPAPRAGSWVYRRAASARASIVARSRSVAGPAKTTARWMAAKAVRSSDRRRSGCCSSIPG